MDLLVQDNNSLFVDGDLFLEDLSDGALLSTDVAVFSVTAGTALAMFASVLGSFEVDIVEELVVSLEASHEASVVNVMALGL